MLIEYSVNAMELGSLVGIFVLVFIGTILAGYFIGCSFIWLFDGLRHFLVDGLFGVAKRVRLLVWNVKWHGLIETIRRSTRW